MDLAAKHVAHVISAYGISGLVLAGLLVWVLVKRRALQKSNPDNGTLDR